MFIASFYNNDLIKIDGELYRIVGVNNDSVNRVELNMIDITYKEFLENTRRIQSKVLSGYYIKNSLDKIIKKVKG